MWGGLFGIQNKQKYIFISRDKFISRACTNLFGIPPLIEECGDLWEAGQVVGQVQADEGAVAEAGREVADGLQGPGDPRVGDPVGEVEEAAVAVERVVMKLIAGSNYR